jgi:hypothetical protein
MFIIEIILTVTAWRKGWAGKALLPVGICLAFGFLVGLMAGATNTPVENLLPVALVGDLAAIVSLIVMSANAPAGAEQAAPVRSEPAAAESGLAESVQRATV